MVNEKIILGFSEYETGLKPDDSLTPEEIMILLKSIEEPIKQNGPISIEKIMFNNPATITFWSDGTKTIAKCAPQDKYSKTAGLSICICKKVMGNKMYHRFLEKYVLDTPGPEADKGKKAENSDEEEKIVEKE